MPWFKLRDIYILNCVAWYFYFKDGFRKYVQMEHNKRIDY